MTASWQATPPNIRWGARGGVIVGLVYSAWAVGVYVLRGPSAFDKHGVTLVSVLLMYLGIGPLAGAVVGILRPLIATRFGASLVGLIAGAFVAAGLAMSLSGPPQRWDFDEWVLIPILAVGAGWVIGAELWKHEGRQVTKEP